MMDPIAGHSLATASARAQEDTRLLSRIAAGDERALGSLYDAHGSTVYALALAITHSPEQAEAAVADTFAAVWRDARGAMGSESSVLTWLVSQVRQRALACRADAAPAGPIASALLSRVTERERQALELAWFHGRSRAEIAVALGEPEAVVSGYLRRGMDQLRSLMAASHSPASLEAIA
jgi:RNA polymerase sigma-70 factor (ECF subfamily)